MKDVEVLLDEYERDAKRYQWIREHFTRLVVSVSPMQDGQRIVDSVRIGENLAKCDPQTVDHAIDSAIERYADNGGAGHD